MERLRTAIALNNQGISAFVNTKKNGSDHRGDGALPSFMKSLVILQELLAMCDSKDKSLDSIPTNAAYETTLPPISVHVVPLPCHSTASNNGDELCKLVAFDTYGSDDAVRLDVLQVFSASVIYNISLEHHMRSRRIIHNDNQSDINDEERARSQQKAQLLYEKTWLCLPEQNGYSVYVLMLRALSIHNLGILCHEVGCFEKARDCFQTVRDMVLSSGNILPQMLAMDGDAFLRWTSDFIVDALIGDTLSFVVAAAAA